jgi:hypothetical protein
MNRQKGEIPLIPPLAKGEGKMNGEEMAGAVARPTEKKRRSQIAFLRAHKKLKSDR